MLLSWALFGLGIQSAAHAQTESIERLPALGANPSHITVSGISSGAFMAVQLHVAHSKTYSGVASVAGGIYGCAEGDVIKATLNCMNFPSRINARTFIDRAKAEAHRGAIDPIEAMRNSRVYLFESPRDSVVRFEALAKLREFYEAFVPQDRVHVKDDLEAAHGFPTKDYGNACLEQGTPWLLKCGFDMAGEILKTLSSRLLKAPGSAKPSALRTFDQTEFGSRAAKMFDWGGVYVPKTCERKGAHCDLHIALHGCQMNPDFIQRQFMENAGYNEWAEANGIIVLYPQAAKADGNPNGCWDWFGVTGADYATRNGPQIQSIQAMVERLVAPASEFGH